MLLSTFNNCIVCNRSPSSSRTIIELIMARNQINPDRQLAQAQRRPIVNGQRLRLIKFINHLIGDRRSVIFSQWNYEPRTTERSSIISKYGTIASSSFGDFAKVELSTSGSLFERILEAVRRFAKLYRSRLSVYFRQDKMW